jgi:putative salt-induced outer membrane protein
MRRLAFAAAFAVLAAPVARADPLPQAAAEMIAAAADDPETLDAVVRAAKKANPRSVAEIDAQAAAIRKDAQAQKLAEAADGGVFHGWTGKGELGASASTGNTDDQGYSVSLSFEKETPTWDREFSLSVDHKREDDETTKDRYFGTYAVRYKFTPRLYGVGVLWGERDRFAGFNSRFAESVGLGYRLVHDRRVKLRLEAGPALRQADYLETGRKNTVAARLADYFSWQVTPRLEVTQSLVAYLEDRNPTLLASMALTTKLQRRLSARASYEVRHEADPPLDRENTDTTTRLTLVYDF